MTITSKIKDAGFAYVNSDIDKFEDVPSRSTNHKVFHFNRSITSEEAIKEIEKEGCVPANLSELADWHMENKKNGDWVVALGSVAGVDGPRLVPCLGEAGSGRKLGLGWFGIDWDGVCRFLAVRLGSKSLDTSALSPYDTWTLAGEVFKNQNGELKIILK